MTLTELKAYIDQYINTKTSDDKITGLVHNAVLHEVVESVLEISGTGFGGNLAPDDDPGDQTNPIWFLASEIGTFTYCSGLEVTALPAFIVFKEDTWSITQIGVPTETVESTNTGLKGIVRAGDPEPTNPSEGDWYVYLGSTELAWASEDSIDSPGILILESVEPSNTWVLYAFGDCSSSIEIDNKPTENSTNAVSSGGSFTELSKKTDKVSEAVEGNVPSLDVEGNIVDSGVKAAGLLSTSNVDVSDIEIGETKILTVEKNSDGSAKVGVAITQLDKLASSNLENLLSESADWDGDEITITGNNLTGALGENGQEYYIGSDFFLCISHYVGTTSTDGTATWRRNRGQDCLTEGLTQDDLIIAELQDTDGWSDADFKTITIKSKQGTWWRDITGGYLYMCINTANGWTRVGTPDTITLEISVTSHPILTANLAAYDFATNGLYLEGSNEDDEDAEQGQEWWDETNNAVYKRNMNGYWAKIFG